MGAIGIIVFILLLLIGLPVALAMAIVGVGGICWLVSPDVALGLLSRDIFSQFSSYPLSAILFFVLMGYYVSAAGISRKLYETFYVLFGRQRGGLAIATIGACAGFAAICGSSVATAATMGKIALPEMEKRFNNCFEKGNFPARMTTTTKFVDDDTLLMIDGIAYRKKE